MIIASSVFSSISPLITENNRALAADANEQVQENDSGGVINPQSPQEFEDSIISKTATYTGTPGEYFIDLKVQGKEKEIKEPTDIVIVYDNSNSMNNNNRAKIARNAVIDFINNTLTSDNDSIRIALVTFGTVVLDGRENNVRSTTGNTHNYSHKTFTNNAQTLISKIPTDTPDKRGRSDDGGTNIQQGLQVAHGIINGSNAKNKIIVTITDGAPTVSYENVTTRKGNGTNFYYDEGAKNHGTNTITEAQNIKNDGIDMYSIGIELAGDAGASLEQVEHVMKNIASTPANYYNANQVADLVDILTSLAKGITGTISDGVVTDPMSEFVNLALTDGEFRKASDETLSDGSYYLSASDSKLLSGVNVSLDNNTITLSNLKLGEDQYINIRYKVNINTEIDGFNGTDYFATNGKTTLVPDINKQDSPVREYIVPRVKGITLDISGSKIWDDTGGEMNRPQEIQLELYRTVDDRSNGTLIKTFTVKPDSNDEWKYDFGMWPAYSSKGQLYDYYIKEITVDGYTTSYSEENFDVTNTLNAEPSIELKKTSDVDKITEVGQEVTYTFEIKNTGNVTLNKISLDDPKLGGEITLEKTTLAPGESVTVSKDYTVTQKDLDDGKVSNTATVKGEDPKGDTLEDKDDDEIPATQNPGISLVKEADRDNLVAGEKINYTFTVTNTGNVTLTQVNLTDVLEGLSDINYVSINDKEVTMDDVDGIVLNPGDVLIANASYNITQADVDEGMVENEATVYGTPPNVDEPIQAKDDVTVTQDLAGNLNLEKSSDVETVSEVGETVKYTFVVTNNSNVTMKNITLDDPMLGGEIALDKTTLAPGESVTVSKDYTVTQKDLDDGKVVNIATVKGEDPKGDTLEDEDDDEIPATQNPGISLVKEADRDNLVAGEKINYTFTATNTGNVTLTQVNLTDVLEGLSDIDYVSVNGEDIEDLEAITLNPGAVLIANASYNIAQDDVDKGMVENEATVFGTPIHSEEPISATDSVSVPQDIQGNLTLDKSTETTEYTEVGQTILYKFVISNDSNVTMKNITLDDPMLGGNIELESTMLNPGKSVTVSKEYTVTQEDLDNGKIVNVATVKGEDPRGNTSTDEDDVTIVGTQHSELMLEKTSDTEEITKAGQVVTYNFKVTNNGNITVKNIVLNDPMLGGTIDLEKTTLAPGESVTVSKEYTVTQDDLNNGEVKNIATVTGETPDGETPEDEDEVTIPGKHNPSITLEKVSDVKEVEKVGDVVTYTFTITNNGNVDLHRVILNDPMLGGNIELESTNLNVGESLKVSVQHKVTEEQLRYSTITNKAIASGLSPNNELVYEVDDAVINTVPPIVVPEPEGEITKEVNGKGGYRVEDNDETFVFDIKALLKKGQDVETLTIYDEIDERLEIESVDVTIDEDTVIETSADEIKKLESEKVNLESDLKTLENELEALESTYAQMLEKEETDVPVDEEESNADEAQEPVVEEEANVDEVQEPVVEEETPEEQDEPAVEEQQEPANEESEEKSDPKASKPINTEALEAAIEELKEQISTLKAEIEDIDVQISELKADNINLKAGSILEYGELVQNGQKIEFKITDKEVIKALEGQSIKMTIKAKFKTIDDDALTNGVDNTATITFDDKPKVTNTVVVYPIKEEEPTPEEPEVPEKPEEPEVPEKPEKPEVPVKPTPEPEKPKAPQPTKEVQKDTPKVEKTPKINAEPKVEEKEKLPETGEAHNSNFGIAIGLALAGALMLLITRRRKVEK
ncbi:DUF7507 domain-containing protein [Phocicoccus pinnipedialis]|uniref:DUF7507 domain-containing protein n=1 Tax=Phocicoccus pinnipedialis TaxID=110845 RepID=UPI00164214F7|nr:Cna B-type domain-containing protein [Jeotgalicoccus pinnipedialis]